MNANAYLGSLFNKIKVQNKEEGKTIKRKQKTKTKLEERWRQFRRQGKCIAWQGEGKAIKQGIIKKKAKTNMKGEGR